jgi:hypothetical protein
MSVDEGWICERCNEIYCENCSATMTYHNTIDYSCCCNCSDQQHKYNEPLSIVIKNNITKLKKEDRKQKLSVLLDQINNKTHIEIINKKIKDDNILLFLKNKIDTTNYLLNIFGKPINSGFIAYDVIEVNMSNNTWRYMFNYEWLYTDIKIIDLI